MDDEGAQAFARRVANNIGNRVKYINAIQCSGWNDALYGTYGYGQNAAPAPTGRAIRLLPQHPNNLRRLRELRKPIRNIRLGTTNDQGKGNALGVDGSLRGNFELLWLPAIDIKTLWESDGDEVSMDGPTWQDGTRATVPPPWVQQLGIEVPAEVNRTDWGCGLGELGFS